MLGDTGQYQGSQAFNNINLLTQEFVNPNTGSLFFSVPLVQLAGKRSSIDLKVNLFYSAGFRGTFGLPANWGLDLPYVLGGKSVTANGRTYAIDLEWTDVTGHQSGLRYINNHGISFRKFDPPLELPSGKRGQYGYTLCHVDGSIDYFDSLGKPIEHYDIYGNCLQYSYVDGDEHGVDSPELRIDRILDSWGQEVLLFHDQESEMRVRLPDGTETSIQSSGSNVDFIRGPAGRTNFEYVSFNEGPGILSRITYPSGLISAYDYTSIQYITSKDEPSYMPAVENYRSLDSAKKIYQHKRYIYGKDSPVTYTGAAIGCTMGGLRDALMDDDDRALEYNLDQDEKLIAQTCTLFNNLHLPIQETRHLLNDQGEFIESLKTVLTYNIDKENRARSTSYNLPIRVESFRNTSSQGNLKWKPMKRSDAHYDAYDNPVETTEWLHQSDGSYIKQSSVRTEYITTIANVQLPTKSWVSDELSRFVQYKEHRTTEDGRNVASAIISFQETLDAGVKLQPWKETSFQYDVVGRLVSTTLAWSSMARIPEGTLGSMTTKTEYSELQDGILHRTEIDANGSRTVFQQDMRRLNGLVIRKTLPRGQSETFQYDGIGRLVQHTNSLGQSTTTAYVTGPAGTTKTATSPQRYSKKFFYDVLDHEVVVYDNGDTTLPFTDQPTRVLSRKSYDTLGRVRESVDQFGLTTKFQYDTLSRPVAETDPHGNVLGFRYDNGGLMVTQTVNGERRKVTELDVLSRLVRQTEYPDTGALQYLNQISTSSNGLALSKKRARDDDIIETSKRQKTLNSGAISATTKYQNPSPDHFGAICMVHEITYNGAGKIIQKSSSQKAIETGVLTILDTENTTYGPDHTVLSQTITGYTAQGSDTIHRQYISDLFTNHVTYTKKTTYADGRTFTHQGPIRNYTKNNQLESYWHQEGGTERYFYDENNWLQKTIRFDGTQVVYTCDDLGQTIKVVYSSGAVTENTFNADGKLIQVREGANLMKYSLSIDGTLTGVTYSDGRAQGVTLDRFSRAVKEIDAFGVEKETEFNAVGQVVRVDCQGDTVIHSYGTANHTRGQYLGSTFRGTDEHRNNVSYDGFGRPSHNIVQDASSKILLDTLYQYDAHGKVQCLKSSSAVSSELNNERQFSYDGIGQVIQEAQTSAETITSATKFAYDGNSNILSRITDGKVTSMTYNRIDQRTDDGFKYNVNGCLLQDNEGWKYAFDERDRLLSISSSSNTPTTFGYRADDCLAQRSEGDAESATFYNKGGKINAIYTTRSQGVTADSKTSMFFDSGSIVSGSTNGHSIGRVLRQLGSTALIMDSGSQSSATYTAYGTNKTTASSSNILSRFGFTQAFTDEKTGLIYLSSRFYNPAQMAFLSMDSYQTENRYAYCEGDPINRIDPTGHSWVDWLATGAGIAAAFAITAGIGVLTAGTAYPLAMAVLGGALAGAVGNLTSLSITHFCGSRDVSWEEVAWSAGTGALLGGVSAGMGAHAKLAAGGNFAKAVGYGAVVGALGGATKESAAMIGRSEEFDWGRVAFSTVQGAAIGAAAGYWGRRDFIRSGGLQNGSAVGPNSLQVTRDFLNNARDYPGVQFRLKQQ